MKQPGTEVDVEAIVESARAELFPYSKGKALAAELHLTGTNDAEVLRSIGLSCSMHAYDMNVIKAQLKLIPEMLERDPALIEKMPDSILDALRLIAYQSMQKRLSTADDTDAELKVIIEELNDITG